jgi:hypothetical protein
MPHVHEERSDMSIEEFEKLAPFALRARQVVVGRERLIQTRNRLAFVLMTTDMSERSRQELTAIFPCPQVSALTSADIERLFGYHNTKLLGFRRGSLANSALKALRTGDASTNSEGSPE